MRRFISCISAALVLAMVWFPACGADDSTPRAVAASGPFLRTTIGICEDYPLGTGIEEPRRDFGTMTRFGLGAMRISIAWRDYEFDKGLFIFDYLDAYVDAAIEHGIELLAYIAYFPTWATGGDWNTPPMDPADFGDFLRALAVRYRGKIRHWELTNEPDLAMYFDGTVEELAATVIAGAKAVKEVDPENVVVLGGLARLEPAFIERLYELGVGDWVDVINIHGYYETWSARPLECLHDDILRVSGQIAAHGHKQRLWLAEIGYSDYREPDGYVSDQYRAAYPYEHTQAYQAAYLLRACGLALATGRVDALYWYEIKNRALGGVVIGDINNKFLGLFDHDYFPKPAWFSLALMGRLFAQPYRPFTEALDVQGDGTVTPYVRALQRGDGSLTVFAWTRGAKAGRTRVRIPGTGYRGLLLTATGQAGPFVAAAGDGGDTVLTLPLSPQETTLVELFPGRIPARLALSVDGLAGRKLALTVANLGEMPAEDLVVEILGRANLITGAPAMVAKLAAGGREQVSLPLQIGKKAKGPVPVWVVVRSRDLPAAAAALAIDVSADGAGMTLAK